MTVLSRVVRRAASSRRLVRRAERRRSTARSAQDLLLVARLLRRALRQPGCAASVRRRALEKLGLLLCQQPETQGRARLLLLRNSYQFCLSADVLCYPLVAPSECLPAPPQNLLSVKDDALPLGMLAQLQEALATGRSRRGQRNAFTIPESSAVPGGSNRRRTSPLDISGDLMAAPRAQAMGDSRTTLVARNGPKRSPNRRFPEGAGPAPRPESQLPRAPPLGPTGVGLGYC